jgi:uncharacterized membrane protein YheB (UPF0754 family)
MWAEILPWVAPPVLGAIIGYVTNDIAIRMLFRPLKEARVIGLRVPFTPGIFPKERYALARSIGRMVSRELITEEALRRQVHSEKTIAQLSSSVESVSAHVLSLPVSELSRAGLSLLPNSLDEMLTGLLGRLFGSRAFIHAARDMIARGISSLAGRKVREILDRFDLKSLITDRLLPLLAEQSNRESLAGSVANLFGERAGSILSDQTIEALSSLLEPSVPRWADRLISWLRSAETRAVMAVQGRELLPKILERLSVVQRFLLSAGQFDKRLDEKMPEIVDDTIGALEAILRDPAQQRRALALISDAAKAWRDEGVDGQPRSRAGIGAMAASLLSKLLAELGNEGTRQKVYALLEDRLLSGNPSIGSFLRNSLGVSDAEVSEFLSNQALTFLSKPETAQKLSREIAGLVSRFLEDHDRSSLGDLLRVDEARKRKLDAYLMARLVELIDARLPEILRGVDVESLVVQKIDGLDVRDVERLLVQVIASHLKWINVFGAILGFIIGLLQLVLRLFKLA